MRKVLIRSVLVAFCAAGAAAVAEPEPSVQSIVAPPTSLPVIDPIALYGNEMVFDVFRKGKQIGDQVMTFSRDAQGDIHAQGRFHMQIDILFIKGAFTFDYSASEIWRDNKMISMAAEVSDDGEITRTTARLDGDVFKIEGTEGTFLADHWIIPTNHWHRGQVEATTLLNTLTGKIVHVKVERHGIDRVETAQGTVEAERFTYTGDLHDIDVWYDVDGRWVKMRFKARDSSYIEYVCRKCGLPGQ